MGQHPASNNWQTWGSIGVNIPNASSFKVACDTPLANSAGHQLVLFPKESALPEHLWWTLSSFLFSFPASSSYQFPKQSFHIDNQNRKTHANVGDV